MGGQRSGGSPVDAQVGIAEGVDRLFGVADGDELGAFFDVALEELRLVVVGVLEFVDDDGVEVCQLALQRRF